MSQQIAAGTRVKIKASRFYPATVGKTGTVLTRRPYTARNTLPVNVDNANTTVWVLTFLVKDLEVLA